MSNSCEANDEPNVDMFKYEFNAEEARVARHPLVAYLMQLVLFTAFESIIFYTFVIKTLLFSEGLP